MEIRFFNFANAADASDFLESHGGEAFLREQYPLVYRAYLRTRENDLTKTDSGNASDILSVHVIPPAEETANAQAVSDDRQDQYVGVISKAFVNVKEAVAGVTMSGYMYDAVTMQNYGSFYEDFSDQDIRESAYQCVGNCRRRAPRETIGNLVVKYQIDCVKRDGTVEHMTVQGSMEGIQLKDIIETVEITDPKSKSGSAEINVVYKDRQWSSHDYCYPDVEPRGGRVATMLPISGKITFKPRYKPMGFANRRTDDIKLIYEKDISLAYGHSLAEIAKYFKQPQGQTVEFRFDDDWNATLPSGKYNAKLRTLLNCPFFYTVQDTEEKDPEGNPRQKDVPFWIGSTEEQGVTYYIAREDSNVYVPPITYQWGCFAKDTMILMGDGTYKNIAGIHEGDLVWTQEEAVPVQGVITGSDKQVIVIETEGDHRLRVTQGHPVLTSRGCIGADELNIKDRIAVRDGASECIRFLYTEQYEDKIYSLDMGESHILCANGILAGDFRCQSEGLRRQEEELEISEEVQKLIDELRCLNKVQLNRCESGRNMI